MARLSKNFTSEVLEDFEDRGYVISNAAMTVSGNGKICTAFSMKPSGLAVVGSTIDFAKQSTQHAISDLFYVHKVVDMKHTTISGGDFVAVACQALGRGDQIVRVAPIFMDHLLDRHSKSFEFPANETIWSLAISSQHLSVGMEKKIEMFTTQGSANSIVRIPGENVFVLENDGDNQLLVGTNKGNVHTVDVRSRKVESTVKIGAALSNLKISQNHLVASGYDHTLMLFDRRNAKEALTTFEAHQNDCRPHLSLQLHDRLNVVAATGSDNVIRIWSLKDFQLTSTISDEKFVSSDVPPCFVINDSWGPPCAAVVFSGSELTCYS